jgi:DNA-binding transcriptional MocR family regulator
LWLELPPRTNSLALYERALKERISIAPGPMFSPTQKFKNFVRLNCGNVWSAEIESAVQRLGRLAKALG